MPTEWRHAAVRGLLTRHNWSMTMPKTQGEEGQEGENSQFNITSVPPTVITGGGAPTPLPPPLPRPDHLPDNYTPPEAVNLWETHWIWENRLNCLHNGAVDAMSVSAALHITSTCCGAELLARKSDIATMLVLYSF